MGDEMEGWKGMTWGDVWKECGMGGVAMGLLSSWVWLAPVLKLCGVLGMGWGEIAGWAGVGVVAVVAFAAARA